MSLICFGVATASSSKIIQHTNQEQHTMLILQSNPAENNVIIALFSVLHSPWGPPRRWSAATNRRCSSGDQHLLAFRDCCRCCSPASVTALLLALGAAGHGTSIAGDDRDRSGTAMVAASGTSDDFAKTGMPFSGMNALDT
jgi:hypothetical protein